jgi:predicted PurR-regulated permease PerM
VHAERREIVFNKSWLWIAGVVLVGVALYGLREVLTPIFLAFTIAYILDPVVDRLEAWRIPRGAAIAIVIAVFLGLVGAFLLLVIPEIARDVTAVARELPDHARRALTRSEPWLAAQGIQVPHTADEWIAQLKSKADSISANQLAPVGDVLKTLIGGTVSALGAAFGALIVPILAVYLLADFDHLVAGARELVPVRFRPSVGSVAKEIDTTLSQFMRGQLTVMLILAVLYGGSYWILGVRLAVPIGIAAGVLNFVPYVGGAFALVAGILMSLVGGGGWGQLAGVVIAYAVVQTLEGFVITPRIVGESVGLKEVWVLLALFVGGEVFGFLGVLLAVPAAAILKIFVSRALQHYRQSSLFLAPAEALGATGSAEALAAAATEADVVASSQRSPPDLAIEVEGSGDAPDATAPDQPDAATAPAAPEAVEPRDTVVNDGDAPNDPTEE